MEKDHRNFCELTAYLTPIMSISTETANYKHRARNNSIFVYV